MRDEGDKDAEPAELVCWLVSWSLRSVRQTEKIPFESLLRIRTFTLFFLLVLKALVRSC